jgi:hypothetical protein
MKSFTIEEIEKMAADLTIKHPQVMDKIHNKALTTLVQRAKLLAKKEALDEELANNNVIPIGEGKKKK